jgi:ribonuclease HI
MRPVFIEKLCLSLYYACTKFRPYVLSSTSTVVSHHDIMKHMLHKPILSSRIGKWAYSLIEYDLKFEPLRAAKGQVVADFITDHMVGLNNDACMVEITPWKLFLMDQCVVRVGGCVMVSPHGMQYELSVRLEFMCTNNQAEYEGLLHGLEFLRDMGVTVVEALGDSKLVVQQINGKSQCLDGALNCYCDKCLYIIRTLEAFRISHISREENRKANELAQQASGYEIKKGLFIVEERPMIMPESMTHEKSVEGTTRLMVQLDPGGHIDHIRG